MEKKKKKRKKKITSYLFQVYLQLNFKIPT